jgi:hypothetical protein
MNDKSGFSEGLSVRSGVVAEAEDFGVDAGGAEIEGGDAQHHFGAAGPQGIEKMKNFDPVHMAFAC